MYQHHSTGLLMDCPIAPVHLHQQRRHGMTGQMSVDQEVAIFKKGRKKGEEQWFVRVTCNFLGPRVYGPFPFSIGSQKIS